MEVFKRYAKYFGVGLLVTFIVIVLNEPRYIEGFLINGILGLFIGGGIEFAFSSLIDVRKGFGSKLLAALFITVYSVLIPALVNFIFLPEISVWDWLYMNRYFLMLYVPFILAVSFSFNHYFTKLYSASNQRLKALQALNEVNSDGE